MDLPYVPHWLVILTVTFLQSLIATLEVAEIGKGHALRAGWLAAVNAIAYCVVVIIFIIDIERIELIPWYVVGNASATALGTWIERRWNGSKL